MLLRIIASLGVGCAVAAAALAVVCWRYHSEVPFANYGYQEIATALPEAGFEYIEAYTGGQTFYWTEIVTSKEYKLEVLRQLGETPQTRWGLLYTVSAARYLPNEPSRKESLYLVVDFLDSPDPIPEKNLVDLFGAYQRAFVQVLKKRGVEVAPSGEITFRSEDRASWKVHAHRHWLKYLLTGCASSLATGLLVQRKIRPNQTPEPTAPSGRGSS